MERLALVGLGKIAEFHLRALQTPPLATAVEVVGGFDVDLAKTPVYCGRPLPRFESVDDLLAQEPTVVIVGTPTTDHYRTCMEILASPHRPRRLVVEKPISGSRAEVEELLS